MEKIITNLIGELKVFIKDFVLECVSKEVEEMKRRVDGEELLTRIEAAAYIKFHPKTFDKKGFKKTILADGTIRYKRKDLFAPITPAPRKRTKRGIAAMRK